MMLDLAKRRKYDIDGATDAIDRCPTLDEFLKTGRSRVRCGPHHVLRTGEAGDRAIDRQLLLSVKRGRIYDTSTTSYAVDYLVTRRKLTPRVKPDLGFLFTKCRGKPVLLVDGSLDRAFHPASKHAVTLSFECLGRFFMSGNSATRLLMSRGNCAVANGQAELIDYTPDHTIDCTAEEIKAIKRDRNKARVELRPPALGYTPIIQYKTNGTEVVWHRPATVLFYVKKTNTSIIMGSDEDAYFGCELSGRYKTVADAFLALAPAEAVSRKRLKPGVMRQGEWFAIPVGTTSEPPKNLPEQHNSIARAGVEYIDPATPFLALPKETEASADHRVTGDVRITSNGEWFVRDFRMTHSANDHAPMRSFDKKTWYVLKCNNALRSFSEQGVD